MKDSYSLHLNEKKKKIKETNKKNWDCPFFFLIHFLVTSTSILTSLDTFRLNTKNLITHLITCTVNYLHLRSQFRASGLVLCTVQYKYVPTYYNLLHLKLVFAICRFCFSFSFKHFSFFVQRQHITVENIILFVFDVFFFQILHMISTLYQTYHFSLNLLEMTTFAFKPLMFFLCCYKSGGFWCEKKWIWKKRANFHLIKPYSTNLI